MNENAPKPDGNALTRRRTTLLAAALILLTAAVVWRLLLSANSLSERIAKELRAHGCAAAADELYQERFERDTAIAELLEGEDVSEAVAASLECGFPSDVERRGDVYLLLAKLGGGNAVLTVFVVDENVELAFIQLMGADEIYPADTDPGTLPAPEARSSADHKNIF